MTSSARMPVIGRERARSQFNEHLDHFMSLDAEVVPLQFPAMGSYLLGARDVQRRDEQRHRDQGRFQFRIATLR